MPKAHALIIDDNAQNLEVLSRLLALHDISYTAIQNTDQLENLLATAPQIDIVFLDIEMPRRNGYELLGVLRNLLGNGTTIIACTVHLNEMSRAQSLGFDGFIAKPLDPKLFATQLGMLMQGQPIWNIT
jgi:CheY-like chemotaxis protein